MADLIEPSKNATSGRTVPFQVICPALSRSGTDSMRKALEILGIGRTFHGFCLGERPNDQDIWIDLVDRRFPISEDSKDVKPISAEDFDQVIGDFGGVTDMPCAAFWSELMDAYPEAKVVLVERPLGAWWQSFRAVVVDSMMSKKGQLFANPIVASYVGDRKIQMMFQCFFGYFQAHNKEELAANAKRIYTEHNAAIRKRCREEGRDFLDYKLGSGWQPLSDFLGLEVPKDVDFPRGNELHVMVSLTHNIQRQRVYSLMRSIGSQIAVVAGVGAAAWMTWTRPQLLKSWVAGLSVGSS